MLNLLLAALALLSLALGITLWRVLQQLAQWAALLQSTPADSNQRLACAVRLGAVQCAAVAINARLDESQRAAIEAGRTGRELQSTIVAVSHDIRTPLAGAAGYLELLQETDDPARRAGYLDVVSRRLKDLETLLDELFLYTRLTAGSLSLDCAPTPVYPALCEALAALYPKLEQAGITPQLDFTQENLRWHANPEALNRVLRNLVMNAAQHGAGCLQITQKGNALSFANRVANPAALDPAHMFDRFWRADPARGVTQGGAGLGLSIVRQLTERMGGCVAASVIGDTLTITLTLPA